MAVGMRAGGSWRDPIGIYGRAGGSWRLIKNVYARAGGSWRRVGGAMSGASASGNSGVCVYWPPDTSCIATATVTAHPIGGYPPFTYQWEMEGHGTVVGATSKTYSISGSPPFIMYYTLRCRVRDTSGATFWTNWVTVSLQADDGRR